MYVCIFQMEPHHIQQEIPGLMAFRRFDWTWQNVRLGCPTTPLNLFKTHLFSDSSVNDISMICIYIYIYNMMQYNKA